MQEFDPSLLKKLNIPPPDSHKGQNGKLLLIGGSKLFHAASLWSLQIASKIVDMVFYAGVPENNEIVQQAKEEFRNGIVVKREDLESYLYESDCILIGPGMLREDYEIITTIEGIKNIEEIDSLADSEGEQTYLLTGYLLNKYKNKKWVLDAGALQMMDPQWLLKLEQTAIITPHKKEFEKLFKVSPTNESIEKMSKKYNVVILVKGQEDFVCSPEECFRVSGGNAGMTKGGTGDVLAGLTAALYCKNDAFLSASCASYINKKAGESLFEKVGYYFNSSDLVKEIPYTMKRLIKSSLD